MHGLALNMNTELDFYSSIVPCGIADRGVTSLAREVGHMIDEDDCRRRVVSFLAEEFDASITPVADLEELMLRLGDPVQPHDAE